MSALHRAARLSLQEEAAALLAAGGDVNAVSVHHFTPLQLAAREGQQRMVLMLLEAGADSGLTHHNGRTALHFAAGNGHLDVVRVLVEHGADIDAQSKAGATPALEAAQFNHREVVAFLLEQGADANVRDKLGLTIKAWLDRGGIQGTFEQDNERYLTYLNSPQARQRELESVRRMMTQGLSAEEWAAEHGRNILVWSYGEYPLDDAEATRWAARVTEILRTPALLELCEEQHLHGKALEESRRHRARQAKRAAKRATVHGVIKGEG